MNGTVTVQRRIKSEHLLEELHHTLVKCTEIISLLITNTYALVTQVDSFLLPHTARATTHADKFFYL